MLAAGFVQQRLLIPITLHGRKSGEVSMEAGMMLPVGRRGETHACEALGGSAAAGERKPLANTAPNTLLRQKERSVVSGNFRGKLAFQHPKIATSSSGAAVCARRSGPIRKKIIGHGMSVFLERLGGRCGFRRARRTFAQVHQVARQHGGGAFIHPLVEKRGNLLAEIRGVAEPGEFVALQRDARGREKELPRRLGIETGQAGPPGGRYIYSKYVSNNCI